MAGSPSNRLRLSDTRRVFRLLGEIRELRDQPTLRRQRMIDGLCELLGAWQGFSVHFEHFTALEWVKVASLVTGGSPDARSLRWFAEWASRGRLREDPLVDESTRLPGPVVAHRRVELVDPQTHEQSGVYEGWYDPADVGDTLVGFHRGNDPSQANGLALHRERGEPAFSERDRKMLRLFMVELYRLYRDGKLEPRDAEPTVAPRQQQVLQCVLAGRSAKEIAYELAISQRTVEEYMRALYEKFGVTTRAELMAVFIDTVEPSRQVGDDVGDG